MQTSVCRRFSEVSDFLGDFVLGSGIIIGIASSFNCNLKVFRYLSNEANELLKTKSDSRKCFSRSLECIDGLKYILWHFDIQIRLKFSFFEKKAIFLSLQTRNYKFQQYKLRLQSDYNRVTLNGPKRQKWTNYQILQNLNTFK